MRCEHPASLVAGLADGALGPLARLRARRRVAACPGCATAYESLAAERTALRTALPRHRAPPALAVRIGAAIAAEPRAPAPSPRSLPRRAGPFAATALGGALAGALLVLALPRPGAGPDTSLLDAHVRAMMEHHLIDVPSEDRHTVRPWLSARLDISPPVRDLSAAGFVLLGGRTDVVQGHRAAVIVYRRDRHIIDLFAWADPRPAAGIAEHGDRGFNLVEWRQDGMAFRAVSDLEPAELVQFARLVAAAP